MGKQLCKGSLFSINTLLKHCIDVAQLDWNVKYLLKSQIYMRHESLYCQRSHGTILLLLLCIHMSEALIQGDLQGVVERLRWLNSKSGFPQSGLTNFLWLHLNCCVVICWYKMAAPQRVLHLSGGWSESVKHFGIFPAATCKVLLFINKLTLVSETKTKAKGTLEMLTLFVLQS